MGILGLILFLYGHAHVLVYLQLLSEAQDPDKLCRMFCGWASWV
eukprot:gene15054-21131_t